MKRLLPLILIIALLLTLTVSAHAATGASSVRVDAVLSDDGTCQITATVDLHMDQPLEKVLFPIPGNAYSISVGGGMAVTRKSGGVTYVDLSRMLSGVAGDFTVILRYSLPGTVTYNDLMRPELNLPLLSGFEFPVFKLDFTVTLPEQIQYTPVFSSGYHQQTIEEDLLYIAAGNQISGSVSTELKDHETLSMRLELTEETFPRTLVEPWSAGVEDQVLMVLAILGLLYWIIFLRCAPHRRQRSTHPPEGCTAGELGCVLTGQGADLTMMVLTWARLGYILIHINDTGRLKLHKRMEMGNERGRFENKVFERLFGTRRTVDGSSHHYAELCRKVAASRGSAKDVFLRSSGNPRILRIIGVAAGVCGGASLGMVMAGNALLSVLLVLLTALLGGIASWFIQDWFRGLHLRSKHTVFLSLGLSALWLGLGLLNGEGGIAAGVVAGQLLVGLAGPYGGRRTETGRRTTSEILGLRHHLKNVTTAELERLMETDPDYFFTMAPCAIALGVGKAFAARFGKRKLHACPYLTTGMDGHMKASEWMEIMLRAVDTLDEQRRRLLLERFLRR